MTWPREALQRNNWGCEGGFFGVLHTWGSALNWHPHLHCLVSGGGVSLKTGRWMKARPDYLFPVRSMSKVFAAILLRKLEEHDADLTIKWPKEARTLEGRRDWRLLLARKTWVVYSKATLGNTRAVVRYLARYTSRIAMSNQRILEVDETARTVRFAWKDYRDGGKTKTKELSGKDFIHRFCRHLVPEGLRRIRYYGLLTGRKERFKEVPGAPQDPVGEHTHEPPPTPCPRCQGTEWTYGAFYVTNIDARRCVSEAHRFSLYGASAVP